MNPREMSRGQSHGDRSAQVSPNAGTVGHFGTSGAGGSESSKPTQTPSGNDCVRAPASRPVHCLSHVGDRFGGRDARLTL